MTKDQAIEAAIKIAGNNSYCYVLRLPDTLGGYWTASKARPCVGSAITLHGEIIKVWGFELDVHGCNK